MAVYSGREDGGLDLITATWTNVAQVKRIYDEICSPDVGQIRFVSDFYDLTEAGLVFDDGIWRWSGETDFDGWVYPDGSMFSTQDFPAAFAEYGVTGQLSFAVPDMTDMFFKGSAGRFNPNVPQKSELQSHTHSLTDEKGIQTEFSITSGFVFCAAGNCNSFRTQRYYTHPATIDDDGNQLTGNMVGTKRPFNKKDPNYPPAGTDPKKWSLEYKVPALHSGAISYKKGREGHTKGKYLPFPIDMKLKLSDVVAWFSEGQTTGPAVQDQSYQHDVGSGRFAPESICVPAMIYIGRKRV